MAGARHDAADRGHPCADQPAVVQQPLIAQRIDLVDLNDMRRKPAQLLVGGPAREACAVLRMLARRVIHGSREPHHLAGQKVPVIFLERRQLDVDPGGVDDASDDVPFVRSIGGKPLIILPRVNFPTNDLIIWQKPQNPPSACESPRCAARTH